MNKLFTWKSVLSSFIFLALIFLLSNLGLLPRFFWNLWSLLVVFFHVIFWVTLVRWVSAKFGKKDK